MIANLSVREIVSLDDPLYDDWLDLYQQAFPLNEQMLVSDLNSTLRTRRTDRHGARYLACMEECHIFVGMALVNHLPMLRAAHLVYLAVDSERRNEGIGAWFYAEIVRRIRLEGPDCTAAVLEVELPDHSADAAVAARRIAFYERHGACFLHEVRYTQDLVWQPPVPMGVMVHLFEPMTRDEMADLACRVLPGARPSRPQT